MPVQGLDLDDRNRLAQEKLLPGHSAIEAHQGELGYECLIVRTVAASHEILWLARPLQSLAGIELCMKQSEALPATVARIDRVDPSAPVHPQTLGLRRQCLCRRQVDERFT